MQTVSTVTGFEKKSITEQQYPMLKVYINNSNESIIVLFSEKKHWNMSIHRK